MIRLEHLFALGSLALLAGCRRPLAVSAEPDSGARASTVDVQPISAPKEVSAQLAPQGPAPAGVTNEERRRVVGDLLSGAYRVGELPEAATDVGRPFDGAVRKRLTEVDVSPGTRGNVQIEGATQTVPITNVDRVIASLRARFRQCYERASDDGSRAQSGTLVVSFVVDDKGNVTSAKASTNKGVPEVTVNCVVGHIRRPQFDAPQRPSTVTVQLNFTPGT